MPKKKSTKVHSQSSAFHRVARDYAHNLLIETNLLERDSMSHRDDGLRLVFEICGVKVGVRSCRADRDELMKKCTQYVRANRGDPRTPSAPESVAAVNLALLAELFGLDREERDILQFLLAVRASKQLGDLTHAFDEISLTTAAEIITAATRVPLPKVRRAISRGGRLLESGLICRPHHARDFEDMLEVKRGLLDAILTPGLDEQQLFGMYLTRKEPSALTWDDYTHIKLEVETVRDLIAAAVRSGRQGVNVLFVGPTGTGKTELAQLLAAELATELYAVGAADEDGDPADARERLSSLLLAQRLLAKHRALGSVLILATLIPTMKWPIGPGQTCASTSFRGVYGSVRGLLEGFALSHSTMRARGTREDPSAVHIRTLAVEPRGINRGVCLWTGVTPSNLRAG